MTEYNGLETVWTKAETYSEGVAQEYRGYTIQKVETLGLNPAHTEWMILNRDGKKVDSYTLNAFDDFQTFKQKLDALIDYNPATMREWLYRER